MPVPVPLSGGSTLADPTQPITVEVWDPVTGQVASAAVLDGSSDRRWRDPLDEPGEGAVTFANDDAALAFIDYGAVMRMFIDGTARFQWRVEAIDVAAVSSREEEGEVTTLSGRGILAVLDDAVVLPFGAGTGAYIGRKPQGDDRLFGWMSDEYDQTALGFATTIATQAAGTAAWALPDGSKGPANWPDPTAEWIWDASGSATDAPEGVVYFRLIFGPVAAGQYALFVAGDDLFTVYLDGVPLVGEDTDGLAWTVTKRAVVTLSAGFHLLTAVVENLPGTAGANPAGLLVSLMEQDQYGTLGAVVANSNAAWRVLAYPSTTPGITAGTLLDKVLTEAQDRGCLAGYTWDFDGALDSAGSSWATIPTVAIPVGSSLLDVVRILIGGGHVEAAVDPASFVLHAWVGGGRGSASAATIAAGVNVTDLTYQGRG